ncbi:MAG: ABC transporter ATP-binding protein [Azospirillaceae bacterium]
MSEIRFEGVTKRFGAVTVFEDIDLTCPEHAYLCLLGPSGCGKTTLMRMVAGLESPDAGDVLIGGERVNDLSPAWRNVGMAFQNYALYPHLSVSENLAFPLRAPIRKGQMSEAEITRRTDEVAGLLRIAWLLDRPVGALSGGQQQRVALGRALIRNPPVLLLDEPVTHLDARLRYEMRAELKTLHARLGTTTIHVTHDQSEALAVADLIAVMNSGEIEQVGPPMAVYDDPRTAFVAGFVGDPPMSVIEVPVHPGGDGPRLTLGDSALTPPAAMSGLLDGRDRVLLGLRPAAVDLVAPDAPGAIAATVYAHEMVGRELQIMLSIGEGQVRYRTPEIRAVAVGEAVACAIDLDGARLFDAQTGIALTAGSDPAPGRAGAAMPETPRP